MIFSPLVSGRPFPIEIGECDEEEGFLVSVPVARSEDRIVVVETKLLTSRTAGETFWEFLFEVGVVRMDEPELAFFTMDAAIAKRYLPDGVRPLVMQIVYDSCLSLLAEIRPKCIYRVTKAIDPPPRALAKHQLVTDALEQAGYVLTETGYDPWRRVFWVFHRS